MPKKKASKQREKALRKARRARKIEEDEDIVDSEEENELDFSVAVTSLKAMGEGVLKASKGIVSLIAGIGMGASGLPAKEVWNILNAPIQDWPNLFKETWKEFSQDKTKFQMLWEGIKGLGSGTVTSLLNTGKEVLLGGFQALGGGIAVVALLKKYFGLGPEVIEAALKSGHPIGLMFGTAGTAVERANQLCQTLQKQLEKYQSLGEVGERALQAIKERDVAGAIEYGAQAAEAYTGQDFSSVRRAVSTAQQLYEASSNPEEMMRIVQQTILPEAQKIVKQFGIKPEQIEAVKGKILFTKDVSGEKRLDAIKGILGKNPNFGIIAQATGYHDALKKLVAHNDPELIEKLTVVNIIGEPGKALSAANLEKLKAEARKQLITGVKRELRDKSGDKIEQAERALIDLKERKEHMDRAISQPPQFYSPSSKHTKQPSKPHASSPYSSAFKPKPPKPRHRGKE